MAASHSNIVCVCVYKHLMWMIVQPHEAAVIHILDTVVFLEWLLCGASHATHTCSHAH